VLDSTGSHYTKTVRCAFCPDEVKIPVYEPRVGHCGEALKDLGPYIGHVYTAKDTEGEKGLFAGKFYVMTFNAGNFSFDKHRLVYEGGYSYDRPTLPHLGFKDQKSDDHRLFFWVCQHCARILGDDLPRVRRILAGKISWHAEIERRAGQIKKEYDRMVAVE
jgi:hypothetical protein